VNGSKAEEDEEMRAGEALDKAGSCINGTAKLAADHHNGDSKMSEPDSPEKAPVPFNQDIVCEHGWLNLILFLIRKHEFSFKRMIFRMHIFM
jgi:hypothetical protein